MIHSARFTCVLDTNVIFPVEIRDLLFWFAHYDLFTPKWSEHIVDEWAGVIKRKGGTDEDVNKRIQKTQQAFPDAMVENYDSLIEILELPDEKDRHVLAAAIKTNANLIVTHNLKDFPDDYLAQFGLSAKSPDDFAADLIDLNPKQAVEAFKDLVIHRRNPDLDEYQVLERFRKNGLEDTANYLHALL